MYSTYIIDLQIILNIKNTQYNNNKSYNNDGHFAYWSNKKILLYDIGFNYNDKICFNETLFFIPSLLTYSSLLAAATAEVIIIMIIVVVLFCMMLLLILMKLMTIHQTLFAPPYKTFLHTWVIQSSIMLALQINDSSQTTCKQNMF